MAAHGGFPRALAVAACVLSAAAGGCGDASDVGGPQPPAGAQLRLAPRVAEPGRQLRATLVPRAGRLEGGLAYRLEVRRGAGWRWLNRDQAFAQILAVATPQRPLQQTIALPPDLRPGAYRIVKTMREAGDGRPVEAVARFQVRG